MSVATHIIWSSIYIINGYKRQCTRSKKPISMIKIAKKKQISMSNGRKRERQKNVSHCIA